MYVLYCTVRYGTVRYSTSHICIAFSYHLFVFDVFQATMKVKDLEERLKKCDADKQLIEEHLREEIRKLRSELDALERTLGHRSSYAAKAAQSVRSLVELIEGQKMELEYQRDGLSTELAALQRNQDELKSRNEQLEADINRLNIAALEEATARVRGTLDGLESQCDSLRNENKTLQEQLDVLQETLKRDRDIHRSTVETVYRLEQQVSYGGHIVVQVYRLSSTPSIVIYIG